MIAGKFWLKHGGKWFLNVLPMINLKNTGISWLTSVLKISLLEIITFRSTHWRCSVKKVFFRNFLKFTGKHLRQGLFFNKVSGLRPCRPWGLVCNFIKREALAHVFSCEFCEISKITFFIEHLRRTASALCVYFYILKISNQAIFKINIFFVSPILLF